MLVRYGRVRARPTAVLAVLLAGRFVSAERRLVAFLHAGRIGRLPVGRMRARRFAVRRLAMGRLGVRRRLPVRSIPMGLLLVGRLLVGRAPRRCAPHGRPCMKARGSRRARVGAGPATKGTDGRGRAAARNPALLVGALRARGDITRRGRPRHRAARRQLGRARRIGAAGRRRAERIALPDQAGELHQRIGTRFTPIRGVLTVLRIRARRSGIRVVSHCALATSLAPAMSCAMTPRQSQT